MVEAMRQRIDDAGASLTSWAVLHEGRYDSPVHDDEDRDAGLSLRGLALNSVDAERLAALDQARSQPTKRIVKGCRLGWSMTCRRS